MIAYQIMKRVYFLLILALIPLWGKVTVGADQFLSTNAVNQIKGKRVGLVTNHTALTRDGRLTLERFVELSQQKKIQLTALFSPEHGIKGMDRAEEFSGDGFSKEGIRIFSLHGKTRRPTRKMLKLIDVLVFDIQDIGSRSYTYLTTLAYCMEECAKAKIPLIVLDRPNPMGGLIVDGPMLDSNVRSFVGYVNVPYCHGMTIGELAKYFNAEEKVNCDLTVIPMKGWQREMTWKQTNLPWIPTSPHIPEAETPLYYPATGLLGELQIVNIGVGYTLPFKCVAAPWIQADKFAYHLNRQNLPGVQFIPFYYRPFYGRYKNEECEGVLLSVHDPKTFRPVTTQYVIIGMLKSLYKKQFAQAMAKSKNREQMFTKVNGTPKVYEILTKKEYVAWPLREISQKQSDLFRKKRVPYLFRRYGRS